MGSERVSTVIDVLRDLADEAAALDALLVTLDHDAWLRPTPADGWDVRDSVAHLALGDDLAFECVTTGRSALMENAAGLLDSPKAAAAFEERLLAQGRAKPPAEVLGWWRSSNERLRDALAGVAPDARLPWGPNEMSATSFITARLMETWAHGLDCFDAAGARPVDTDRLRHVAHLGLRALPYAFMVAGLPRPGPVRLELEGPSGDAWQLGPPDAPTAIFGSASDWCRVATQRDRRGERERLSGEGPDAQNVIRHARAYL